MPVMEKKASKAEAQGLDRFLPLVEQAIKAFSVDDSYTLSMLKSATAIVNKRKLWDIRLRYRELSQHKQSSYEPVGWHLRDVVELLESVEAPSDLKFKFKGKGQGKRLTPEQKAKALALAQAMHKLGKSNSEIGKELELTPECIRLWLKKYGPGPTST